MPENQNVIKTYRYIRLALIFLIVLLGVSVAKEILETGRRFGEACYQTSISAYYYTPAQAVFVSVLVAIGVAMISLKGNTNVEDVLLNLGGMLAPVVAFVPTPDRPLDSICPPSNAIGGDAVQAPPNSLGFAAENVANNMGALLWIGVAALLVTLLLAWSEWRSATRRAADQNRSADERAAAAAAAAASTFTKREFWLGWGVAAAVVAFAMYAFFTARLTFLTSAHYSAAIPMFVIIWLVVVLNSRRYYRQLAERPGTSRGGRLFNRYTNIAIGMAVAAAVDGLVIGGLHMIFWLECSLIVGFCAFWVLQTQELWEQGIRPVPTSL